MVWGGVSARRCQGKTPLTPFNRAILLRPTGSQAFASGTGSMNYVSAPIVEAAAQLSFAEPLDLSDVAKFADDLSKSYPTRSDRADISAQVDVATGEVKADIKKVGYDLRDVDGLKVVIAQTTSVAFSRLAPYPGWAEYSDWLMAGFSQLYRISGPRKLSRVGVRFVNRIDVPTVDRLAHIENYINVYPKSLNYGGENFSRYLVAFTREVEGTDNLFNIVCGSTDTPVPLHAGIQVDIDAYTEKPLTFTLKGVKEKLDELRELKNNVFEQTITDEARKLFGVGNA